MNTLTECVGSFLLHCQYEKGLSPKTLEAYRTDLAQFARFLKENDYSANIQEIDKEVLRAYLRHLSRWKPKTVKRKMACLKALFNHLEFEDHLPLNPFRKMRVRIKEGKQLPVVMEQHEVRRILQAAYQRKQDTVNSSAYRYAEACRDLAVLELLFATGIRVSELCHLRPAMIDLHTGVVRVTGKGNKERQIQVFAKESLAALREYHRLFRNQITATGWFFVNRLGARLSDQSVRFMIRHHCQTAGITKHITPHTFRHTFATLLLESDVDIKYIQQFLGHSSILTTQIYTHVNQKKQRSILAAKHPRGRFLVGETHP